MRIWGDERRDGRRARIIAVAASALLVPSAFVVLAPAAHAGDASTIVSLTNAERSERGLAKYSANSSLNSVAQTWSEKMAKSGKLAHNPSLTSQVKGYRYVGENVGYGSSTSKIFNALMNSTAHRNNILDKDFTQIGVGASRDGNGRLWITQVFREPTGSSSSGTTTAKKKATTKKTTAAKPAAKAKPQSKPTPKPKSTAKATPKVKSTPKPAAAKPTVKPKPKPTPKATPTPAPEPTATAVTSSDAAQAPAAAPVPTFAERLAEANQFAAAAGSTDPLASTMAFDRAMQSLIG